MATREEIFLAALLHDIGKFWQRADKKMEDSDKLSKETKNSAQMVCPTDTKTHQPSRLHALWTAQFFESYAEYFPVNKESLKEISSLAAYHHRPSNRQQAFIQLADWWASGMDRSKFGTFEDPVIETGKERFKEIPLNNIFCSLNIATEYKDEHGLTARAEKIANKQKVFRLQPLALHKEAIFPQDYVQESLLNQNLYEKHWNHFVEEFCTIDKNSHTIESFSSTLFYLLKKYTWCIPSFTQDDHPCNSLFEHSKVTAALAQCLFDYASVYPDAFMEITTETGVHLKLKAEYYPVQLVGFDLSGIQDYLYNITSANAAKSLRGRSFYLQIGMEALAWQVTMDGPLHFTPAHIIYSSGGKFYALLPNTPAMNDWLQEFYEALLKNLWDKHEGSLYVNFGKVPFRYNIEKGSSSVSYKIGNDVVENRTLGDLWKQVFTEMTRYEAQRFKKLLISEELYKEFFQPAGSAGNSLVCGVTGKEEPKDRMWGIPVNREGRKKRASEINEEEYDQYYFVCDEVNQQIEIGEALVNHGFVIFPGKHTHKGNIDKTFDSFSGKPFWIGNNKNNATFDDAVVLHTVEKETKFLDGPKGRNQHAGFRFFGGASVAMNDKKTPATFEELAGIMDEGNGKKEVRKPPFVRLGILRMDVDSLGALFMDGLKNNGQTTDLESFSAYATLSNLLDLFFSGYLNTIREEYKDEVNILYSGGDDVFAVGHWEKVIDFAERVRESFRAFTGRSDISISGGIELVGPKFPIAKAAEITKNAEEKAKEHYSPGGWKKNAITLFAIPLNWDEEWKRVKEIKEKLVNWLTNEYITKGFLMQVLDYYNLWKYEFDRNKAEYINWKWQAAYNIARRQKDLDKDSEKFKALEEIKTILFTEVSEKKFPFGAFAVACRWAEIIYKIKKELKS